MNIETLSHCIICLDKETSEQRLYPIPCHCKAFIHKECFHKLEGNECIICHQSNIYSDKNEDLKIPNKHILINIEENEEIGFKKCKKITTYFSNKLRFIKLKCQEIFNYELYLDCYSLITYTLFIIGYLLATYVIGLLFRMIYCFLNRINIEEVFNDYNTVYHIIFTITAGLFIQIIIGMCSCCYEEEDEIYD